MPRKLTFMNFFLRPRIIIAGWDFLKSMRMPMTGGFGFLELPIAYSADTI
jgi:hypothetical protein